MVTGVTGNYRLVLFILELFSFILHYIYKTFHFQFFCFIENSKIDNSSPNCGTLDGEITIKCKNLRYMVKLYNNETFNQTVLFICFFLFKSWMKTQNIQHLQY